jgi:hypothetical protein
MVTNRSTVGLMVLWAVVIWWWVASATKANTLLHSRVEELEDIIARSNSDTAKMAVTLQKLHLEAMAEKQAAAEAKMETTATTLDGAITPELNRATVEMGVGREDIVAANAEDMKSIFSSYVDQNFKPTPSSANNTMSVLTMAGLFSNATALLATAADAKAKIAAKVLARAKEWDERWAGGSDLGACSASITTPGATIDIVIAYSLDREDQGLLYLLRSFEQHHLLDQVGTVYILVNTAMDQRSVVGRLNQHRQLKVVAMEAITLPFHLSPTLYRNSKTKTALSRRTLTNQWKTLSVAPFLPNLADYYLMVPDDVVLRRNYTRNFWFDAAIRRPYAHSFGSSPTGDTRGYPNIAPLHGPNFLNRCAMQYVIGQATYRGQQAIDPVSVALGEMNKYGLLAGFFGYHDKRFRKIAGADFFSECHTNGGCKNPDTFDDIFVNIQGSGVSAEYTKDAHLASTFQAWFEKTFPTPSRFEATLKSPSKASVLAQVVV